MKKVYINGLGSVSIQEKSKDFEGNALKKIGQGITPAFEPNYKEIIPAIQLRRMTKALKMSFFAFQSALQEADLVTPEAIITGTAFGSLIHSEKFVETLLANHEAHLTPTSFIQSTHNTVSGQIALHLKCHGYNFTYVHKNNSFESALMDAFLQIQTEEINNALVGAMDEIGPATMKNLQLIQKINTENDLFPQAVHYSESAVFFALENEQKETTYAEIVDVQISHRLEEKNLLQFLQNNDLNSKDVQHIYLGKTNLPVDQDYFSTFAKHFPNATQNTYKEYVGHHPTASSFGVLLAAEHLKNDANTDHILLYDQFENKDHSLILLKQC